MVEAKEFKSTGQGYFQWNDLPTNFHKNLLSGS
jgi:hypothetical protein